MIMWRLLEHFILDICILSELVAVMNLVKVERAWLLLFSGCDESDDRTRLIFSGCDESDDRTHLIIIIQWLRWIFKRRYAPENWNSTLFGKY
jgi:hypothetical protein